MQKYRQHTQKQIEETKLEFKKVKKLCIDCDCTSKINEQAKQIDHLAMMMSELMSEGSNEFSKLIEENAKLKTENVSLRQLLAASNEITRMSTRDVACGWSFREDDDSDPNDEFDSSRETVVDA